MAPLFFVSFLISLFLLPFKSASSPIRPKLERFTVDTEDLPLHFARPLATRSPSGFGPAPYVLSLHSSSTPPRSHTYLRLPAHASSRALSPQSQQSDLHSQPITAINFGKTWNTELVVAGQKIQVVFDTGSSDTWVASQSLQCFDAFGHSQPRTGCMFGPSSYKTTPSFKKIPNMQFSIRYGDGEWAKGQFGSEELAVAGLNVTAQIAVVEQAYWLGDGISGGLMGFGYPALTNAYEGDESKPTVYDPVFTRMHKSGVVDPVFTVALTRSTKTEDPSGFLALGGLPPQIEPSGPWTSAPLLYMTLNSLHQPNNQYSFYAIDVEAVSIGYPSRNVPRSLSFKEGYDIRWISPAHNAAEGPAPETVEHSRVVQLDPQYHERMLYDQPNYSADDLDNSLDSPPPMASPATSPGDDPLESTEPPSRGSEPIGALQPPQSSANATSPSPDNANRAPSNIKAIVDTGTTLVYLRTDIADSINSAFQPEAKYSASYGVYTVDCDAKRFHLGISIGGQRLIIPPEDMIQTSVDPRTRQTMCYSGITSSGSVNILGGTFLKNVIAVFDQGASEMRFANRKY